MIDAAGRLEKMEWPRGLSGEPEKPEAGRKAKRPCLARGRFFTRAYALDTLLNLSLLRRTVNFALECSVHSHERIEEVAEVIRSDLFQMLDEFVHLSFPRLPRRRQESLYVQCSAE